MEPALSSGDLLIVKRFNESKTNNLQNSKVRTLQKKLIFPKVNTTIKNNDIIILHQPYKYQKRIIKRCIGLPGDVVYIISMDSILVSNNKDVTTLYTSDFSKQHSDPGTITYCSRTYSEIIDCCSTFEKRIQIPSKGYRVQLEKLCYRNYKEIFNRYTSIDYDNINNKFYKSGNLIFNYEFDQNYFFMLGDNMSISQDSRQNGPFPEEFILGKALLVIYPFKRITINLDH